MTAALWFWAAWNLAWFIGALAALGSEKRSDPA